MLLSIIIPTYNSQERIVKCVKSIQISKRNDFQIIIVDDGSKDRTFKTCKSLASYDSRIVVVRKENGGVSSARNAGLSVASGKYIGFIDSDDTLTVDAIDTMLGWLEESTADAIMYGFKTCNEKGEIVETREYPTRVWKKSGLQLYETFLENNIKPIRCVWSTLYKKSIIDINNVQFNTKYTWGEDFDFNLQFFSFTNIVETKKDVIYNYIVNKESTTSNIKAMHIMSELIVANYWINSRHVARNELLKAHLSEFYCSAIYIVNSVRDEREKSMLVTYINGHKKNMKYVRSPKYKLAVMVWKIVGIEKGSFLLSKFGNVKK